MLRLCLRHSVLVVGMHLYKPISSPSNAVTRQAHSHLLKRGRSSPARFSLLHLHFLCILRNPAALRHTSAVMPRRRAAPAALSGHGVHLTRAQTTGSLSAEDLNEIEASFDERTLTRRVYSDSTKILLKQVEKLWVQ